MKRTSLLLQRGDLHRELDEDKDALKDYKTAYERVETGMTARKIADIYRKLGNLEQALRWLSKAIDNNPDQPEYYRIRADVYETFNKPGQMREDLYRYVKLETPDE